MIAVDRLGVAGTIDLVITAGLPPPTTTTTSTIAPGTPTTTTTTVPPDLAPETTIDAGPKPKVRKRKVTFQFSSNDPAATFECRLDARPFAPCTSPHTLKVKFGKRVFEVRATDLAGHTDQSLAEYRFKRRR